MQSIPLLFCMHVNVTHMFKTRKGCHYAIANVILPPPNTPDYSYHYCCLFVFIYLYHFFSFCEVNIMKNRAGEKIIKSRDIIICNIIMEKVTYNLYSCLWLSHHPWHHMLTIGCLAFGSHLWPVAVSYCHMIIHSKKKLGKAGLLNNHWKKKSLNWVPTWFMTTVTYSGNSDPSCHHKSRTTVQIATTVVINTSVECLFITLTWNFLVWMCKFQALEKCAMLLP